MKNNGRNPLLWTKGVSLNIIIDNNTLLNFNILIKLDNIFYYINILLYYVDILS